MDLYVRLWLLWLVLAALMVNLLVALLQAFNPAEGDPVPKNVSNVAAMITVIILAVAAVGNVLVCIVQTFSVL